MSSPTERARRRASEWTDAIVEVGAPKGPLYESMTPEQRWTAYVALNERAWLMAHGAAPEPLPRAEWPGEVFELHPRD